MTNLARQELRNSLESTEVQALLNSFPKGVICLDLETTGLSPLTDKIIEIAAIKLTQDGEMEVFHQLINPKISIPQATIEFHGITDEDVKDSPAIEEIIEPLSTFLGELPVLAHNALFDIGFIAKDFHLNKVNFCENSIIDSCRGARALFKNKELIEQKPSSFNLKKLCDHFDIKLVHHQALDDAMATLKLYAKMILLSEEKNIKKLIAKSFLFNFDFFMKYKHQELSEQAKELLSIIDKQNKEEAFIIYKGGTKGDDPRRIRPIGLLPWPKGPVLYAECVESSMNKSFIVKKIKKVLTQKQFEEQFEKTV